MLTTPQSITINAVAEDYHRISDSENASVYQTAAGDKKLTVSHQKTKSRFRRMARLDVQIVAADPLTAENSYQTAGVYLVIDEPFVGFTDTQLDYYVTALKTWLSVANVAAILGSRH